MGSKKNSVKSLHFQGVPLSNDKENFKPLSQNVLQSYENLKLLSKNIEKL